MQIEGMLEVTPPKAPAVTSSGMRSILKNILASLTEQPGFRRDALAHLRSVPFAFASFNECVYFRNAVLTDWRRPSQELRIFTLLPSLRSIHDLQPHASVTEWCSIRSILEAPAQQMLAA